MADTTVTQNPADQRYNRLLEILFGATTSNVAVGGG